MSSSQTRHSLLVCAVYSFPLYSNTGPVAFMSRSRLRSQYALDGAYQSVISSALVCRVLLHRDDRLPEDLPLRKVVAVAAAGIHAAVLANRRPEARPHPAAARVEAADFLRRQVVPVELVRRAAAALRGRRVQNVVEDVQRVGLAIGWQKRLGARDLLTGRRIQRAQPSIPRNRVDDVLAGSVRRHRNRRGRLPARAERAAAPPGVIEGAVEVPLPDLRALSRRRCRRCCRRCRRPRRFRGAAWQPAGRR